MKLLGPRSLLRSAVLEDDLPAVAAVASSPHDISQFCGIDSRIINADPLELPGERLAFGPSS